LRPARIRDFKMKKSFYYCIVLTAAIITVVASCDKNNGDNNGNNKDVPVSGVTLNKTTLTFTVGKSETLIATVLPDNADNKNVTWTSTNSFVATVMPNGLVTGLSEGTTTIVVTTQDGAKSASCAVTVTKPMSAVRFKKEQAISLLTQMELVILGEWVNPIYYFGDGAGISPYFEIPSGAHRPSYCKEGYWYDCFSNPNVYNFQEGYKYTITAKFESMSYSFYVTNDGEL